MAFPMPKESPTTEDSVLILRSELESLIEDRRTLAALLAGGVDNWDWYDESLSEHYDDSHLEDDVENLREKPEYAAKLLPMTPMMRQSPIPLML